MLLIYLKKILAWILITASLAALLILVFSIYSTVYSNSNLSFAIIIEAIEGGVDYVLANIKKTLGLIAAIRAGIWIAQSPANSWKTIQSIFTRNKKESDEFPQNFLEPTLLSSTSEKSNLNFKYSFNATNHNSHHTPFQLDKHDMFSKRECVRTVSNIIKEEINAGIFFINIFGQLGSGKSSILSQIGNCVSTELTRCTVLVPRFKDFPHDMSNKIEAASKIKSKLTISKLSQAIVLLIDDTNISEMSTEQKYEFDHFISNVSKINNHNCAVFIIFTSLEKIQKNNFVHIPSELTKLDEENLFNKLQDYKLPDAHKTIENIEEYWRKTGGARVVGNNLSSFINHYFSLRGLPTNISFWHTSTKHDRASFILIACAQILDVVIPTVTFNRMMEQSELSVGSYYLLKKYSPMIKIESMENEAWSGIMFQPSNVAQDLLLSLEINNDQLTKFLEKIINCAIPKEQTNYTDLELEFVRHLFHRLSKGRHIPLAQIDGNTVVNNLADTYNSRIMEYITEHCDHPAKAEWAGTLASIINKSKPGETNNNKIIKNENIVYQLLLDLITNSPEVIYDSPRAFMNLTKAVNKLILSRPTYKNYTELGRSLLQFADLKRLLINDYKRNKNGNWNQRVNSTVHNYMNLNLRLSWSIKNKKEQKEVAKRCIRIMNSIKTLVKDEFNYAESAGIANLKQKFITVTGGDNLETQPGNSVDRDSPTSSIYSLISEISNKKSRGKLTHAECKEEYITLISNIADSIDYFGKDQISGLITTSTDWVSRLLNDKGNLDLKEIEFSLFRMCRASSKNSQFLPNNFIQIVNGLILNIKYPDKSSSNDQLIELTLIIIEHVISSYTLKDKCVKELLIAIWGIEGILIEDKYLARWNKIKLTINASQYYDSLTR